MSILFSAFLAEAYLRLFDGTCLLYPAMHASVDMSLFPILGAILSHAYLVAGVFPERAAFPCVAVALPGPSTTFSDSLLQDCFVRSLSAHEASVMRVAITFCGPRYPPSIQDGFSYYALV